MDFARSTLEKHGWKSGQGLGKNEQGIKEAIKVKLKKDTAGVGHQPGEEFTFHWWDHVFNKAANNLNVENSEDGVQVQKISEVNVSRKKPLGKVLDNKEMLYGRFVKAATLTNGLETPQASDSSSDSDDDESEIHTKISHLTDEELLKICGGRTAHKGARHGIQMNGKLARIEQQEKILAARSYSCRSSQAPEEDNSSTKKKKKRKSVMDSDNDNEDVEKKKKKKKDKRSKKNDKEDSVSVETDANEEMVDSSLVHGSSEESTELSSKKRKKKKRRTQCDELENMQIETNDDGSEMSTSKKKKKKSKSVSTPEEDRTDAKKSRKQKKRKSKGDE